MTLEHTGSAERSARVMLRAFALISAVIALTALAAIYSASVARSDVRRSASTAVSRVELVCQMGSAIDHERILVDAHIFERGASDMGTIEARIAALDREFDRSVMTLRATQRAKPRDPERLERVVGSFEATRQQVERVIALSRDNQDIEARAAMLVLSSRFEALDRMLVEMIRETESESDAAVRDASAVQLGSIALSTAMALAAIGASIALGLWAYRVVREREEDSIRHARALEESNRDLDAFAARVAHDLRGPLTTIGLAGARLAEVAPAEAGTSQILNRGVSRMEALIADLLALSRIASEGARGECDTAEIAAQVEADLAPNAERIGARVRYDVTPARIECSPVLFRQVLANLVENALKYKRTGVEPEVLVTGTPSGREYVLTVADNGVGMEPDDAQRIFEPFYRSPRVAHVTGTGLGLSIVKRIVDTAHGTLSVDSVPGRGTTFVVRLMRVQDHARSAG